MLNQALPALSVYTKNIRFKEELRDNRETVYLLGQGWLSKGFVDHIDFKQYKVVNIYKDKFVNTGQLITSPNKVMPFCKEPFNFCYDDEMIERNYSKSNHDDIHYCNETVLNIDLNNNLIITDDRTINYGHDILVVGLGCEKPVSDWKNFKLQYGKYDIIGSGLAGTELAFRLSDFNSEVTLYDMQKNPLSMLPPSLQSFVKERFNTKNIQVVWNQRFNGDVDSDVIMAVGSKPNDIVKGWVQNKYLMEKTSHNVYFGGDCVRHSDIEESLTQKSAQQAYDQGKHIALDLNSQMCNEYKVKKFYSNLYLGNGWFAIYTKGIDAYLILPKFCIDLYYRMAYGSK